MIFLQKELNIRFLYTQKNQYSTEYCVLTQFISQLAKKFLYAFLPSYLYSPKSLDYEKIFTFTRIYCIN